MAYLIALVALIADRLTKLAVVASFQEGEGFPLISGILHITYVKNTGAAFGIFSGSNVPLLVFAIIMVLAIFIYLQRTKNLPTLARVSIGLILGGAVGNIIDRIARGFVVDFIDFRVINYPVFNLADCCIVSGAILLCVYYLFFDKQEKEAEDEENGED